MHRIDTPNNNAGLFRPPSPPHNGPVVVDSDWLNDLQENIMAVLASAGVAPVKGDYSQLAAGIAGLISNASRQVHPAGNYAIGPGDHDQTVFHTPGGTNTYTLPLIGSAGIGPGFRVRIGNIIGGGVVTVTTSGGDVLRWMPGNTTGDRSLAAGAYAYVEATSAGSWWIRGDGIS